MIHSPHSPGDTLKRVNAVLGLYYDPDFDPETKALVREEFVRSLAPYPDWAVQRALDRWASTGTRRPSPGEIVLLADRQMEPYRKELARRKRAAEEQATEKRIPPNPAEAQAILDRAGFTAKRFDAMRRAPMASTFAEAEAITKQPRAPHWTETASESEVAQMRAARAANPLIQANIARARMEGES